MKLRTENTWILAHYRHYLIKIGKKNISDYGEWNFCIDIGADRNAVRIILYYYDKNNDFNSIKNIELDNYELESLIDYGCLIFKYDNDIENLKTYFSKCN